MSQARPTRKAQVRAEPHPTRSFAGDFRVKPSTLLKRLEIGFYLGSATFQEGWQGQFVPELGNVFVDCESRAIGSEFKQDLARFAEVETLKIVAIDFAAIRDAEIF